MKIYSTTKTKEVDKRIKSRWQLPRLMRWLISQNPNQGEVQLLALILHRPNKYSEASKRKAIRLIEKRGEKLESKVKKWILDIKPQDDEKNPSESKFSSEKSNIGGKDEYR